MLANEYGYQVSPRPAADYFPAGYTQRLWKERQRWHRAQNMAGFSGFVGGVMLLVVVIPEGFSRAPGWTIAVSLVGILGVPLSLAAVPTYSSDSEVILNVADQPFQVWPCQLEQAADGGRMVLLLRPDGGVARELLSPVPDDVWHGMVDGRGILWIAGDLRFGCIVATPGAVRVWAAHGAPYGSRASRSGGGRVEEELLRTAVQETFDNWLP
ncbi:hypothetical protein [Streptomyces palmae]|uniref:Uncharacterized protein n=1 Tax=Streptomyces palmae TaxID=1701085 RepID=A0A4Z0GNW0_9ACTN|nr:hypothetical protein [Streptomyces palmae]TGA98057.1 hypothetical protein E4099_23200 [Streptomyces palmae]